MILQRITGALKRRDWSQITTEILIVVIGIFLGLQVQAWYEELQNRELEIVYIERLLKDADNSIIEQQIVLGRMTDLVIKFNQLLKMLSEGQITNDNLNEFSSLYLETRGWVSVYFFQETINEMISSGTLSVIRSTEFRTKISQFRNKIRLVETATSVTGENILNARQKLGEIIMLDSEYTQIILSPTELNNNDKMYNLLNHHASFIRMIKRRSIIFNDASKIFRDEIATELERLK